MNREAFEAALDGGRLETRLYECALDDGPSTNWHPCRRTGMTHVRRVSGGFGIPIAFNGGYMTVDDDFFQSGLVGWWFRVIHILRPPPRVQLRPRTPSQDRTLWGR